MGPLQGPTVSTSISKVREICHIVGAQKETLVTFKRIRRILGFLAKCCGFLTFDFLPGPSSPRNVQADPLSINAIRLRWQPPEDPNGGIIKYSIEYQRVGQTTLHPWVDTDDGNKTTMDVTSLNGSTLYQFRVRAFSKVPGDWSMFVKARTQENGNGKFEMTSNDFGLYHILVRAGAIPLNLISSIHFYYIMQYYTV